MQDTLIPSSDRPAIPLTAVSKTSLDTWRKRATEAERNWVSQSGFDATPGTTCLLPGADGQLQRVLVGIEEPAGIWSCAALPSTLPARAYTLDDSWPSSATEALCLGWLLGSYRFDRYNKKERPLAELVTPADCDRDRVYTLAGGIARTRDLINTPAQDMMPQHLSAALKELAAEHQAEFKEIVGDQLLSENYPAIHAVGRASAHAPRLLELRWGSADAPKLTLVGKGVCFDSGGLDLKPSSGMRHMKKDMGGAAHVIGLADMIMRSGLPVRLRVLIPAVENAVSGDAFRPGDVLDSRGGITIEIDNTDAEGRLVLCDALTDAISEEPDLLIDMATLTGAARVALGPDVPAIFSNRSATAAALQDIGSSENDPLWPMPLFQPYRRWLNSDIAAISNSASGPYGGAITAALFLQEFIGKERDWVHMDVMAWNTENQPGRPRGGEAMGLRTFFCYLEQRFGR